MLEHLSPEVAAALVAGAVTFVVSLAGWGTLHIRQGYAEAEKRGKDESALQVEKDARMRLFQKLNGLIDNLRELEAQVDKDRAWTREVLIEADIVVPEGTQGGSEGRGVKNPLHRSKTVTKSEG